MSGAPYRPPVCFEVRPAKIGACDAFDLRVWYIDAAGRYALDPQGLRITADAAWQLADELARARAAWARGLS